jgi:hypothetical protein
MILGSNIRAALLATIAFTLTASAVCAGNQQVRIAAALRAPAWNLEITARRPAMRALVSHGEVRTRTPIAKQLCAVSPNSNFDQGLHVTGSPWQFLSRPPVLTGNGLHPGRAPPTV